MASPTQWTWVWVSSGSWWWTRRPGLLQSMGSQIVRHDWATELNWTLSSPVSTSPFSRSESLFLLMSCETEESFLSPRLLQCSFGNPGLSRLCIGWRPQVAWLISVDLQGLSTWPVQKKPILHVGKKPPLPQTCILEDDIHSPQTQKRNHCIFCVKPKLPSSQEKPCISKHACFQPSLESRISESKSSLETRC